MTYADKANVLTAAVEAFDALEVYDDANLPQEPPEDGYVYLRRTWGEKVQVACGNDEATWLQDVALTVEIRTRANRGDGAALAYAQEIEQLLKALDDDDLELQYVRLDEIGPEAGTAYNRVDLVALFTSETTESIAPPYEVLPVRDRLFTRYTVPGHGFARGQVVRVSASPALALASASSEAGADALGVVSRVITDEVVEVTTYGKALVPGHGLGAVGTKLFLGETAGQVTATAPSTPGAYVQPLGEVLAPDAVMVRIGAAEGPLS